MEADIHTRFQSDFYRILDFKCRCTECGTSKPEYSESFCISFVRKGNFLYNVFRRSFDSYTGCVLITKPSYERTVTHVQAMPDECTIIDFKKDFYQELLLHYGHTRFMRDNDWHSAMMPTTGETEALHHMLLQNVQQRSVGKLEADQLVMQIIAKTLHHITDYTPNPIINARLKKNHLLTIEQAKEYIMHHFTEDVSLMEVAAACFVSPFHFSRIFKTFTGFSPHQFLLSVRLQQAEMLLRTTLQPVSDVAFSSGFNSIEYFTAAFKKQYRCPPATFRSSLTLTPGENSRIS